MSATLNEQTICNVFVSCFFLQCSHINHRWSISIYLFRLRSEEKLLVLRLSLCQRRVAVKSRLLLDLHKYASYTMCTCCGSTFGQFRLSWQMHRRIIVAYVMRSHLCDKNEYKTICKRSQERYMMHLHAPHFFHTAIILFRLDRHWLKRDTKVKRVRIPPSLFHHTAHDDTLT